MKAHVRSAIAVMIAMLWAGHAGAEHHEHAHHFGKDVDALHAVLAPLWHEKTGKKRSKKVCAQAGKLETLTKNIPSGDTAPLLDAIGRLKAQCKTNPTQIDGVFSEVHDAFHHLAEH